MRLLWFASNASHFEALQKLIKQAGLADAQSYHHQSQDLLVAPSCDCIEFKVDFVDESLLQNVAQDARTDFLLVRDEYPKLALFDMDSTLIQQEVINQLAGAFGLGQQVSVITERAMRGELDFVASFTERLSLLRGLAQSELDVVAQHLSLMPGADVLAANLTGAGVRQGIVSGGFSYFAEQIGEQLGMDFVLSNTLECQNGKVTGKVIPPVIDGSIKLKTLVAEASALRITLSETMAVGDGANDIPMLLAAGIGVAYHAKPKVRADTNHCLNYQDLSALAYLVKF
ncbi:MAG TPA: phosphoserine phosphatase SerB [Gammaproteobacteria bacterium]|nr:phosphoserine phosphatase SerB [Gammaproteobacteria bacterium]